MRSFVNSQKGSLTRREEFNAVVGAALFGRKGIHALNAQRTFFVCVGECSEIHELLMEFLLLQKEDRAILLLDLTS